MADQETVSETERPTGEAELYAANPTMFRNHPFRFVLSVLLLVAGVVAIPASLTMLVEYEQTAAIGSGVVAAIAALTMVIWWIKTRGTKLTVTSTRTILRRGLLSKHINEVSHSNIRNIQIRQNPLERIFSTGTVQIATAGHADIEIEVAGLPHPEKIRELINRHRNG